MSRKIFDPNIDGNWEFLKMNVDNSCDIEKKMLLSSKYEDTVFICSDGQYFANKFTICKYSSRIRKLVLESDKTIDSIHLPDITGQDFFLFRHFVYTKSLYPVDKMSHYYDVSFIFESQELMKTFFRYISIDNGNLTELLEFLRFQYITKDSNVLNALLTYRKISLEKLRISRILMLMDMEELTKFNIAAIIGSWGALEAFTFIECWISHLKEKRNGYKNYLYSCVDLSSFDLKYSGTIPYRIFTEIVKHCNQPEQIEYVKKIYEHRQKDILSRRSHKNTIDYRSFDIEFWRKQNIKKLTQECGDVNWFKIVYNWFNYNQENNVQYLVEMLQHIDFSQIDSSFLTTWVTENKVISRKKSIFKFFKPYITEMVTEIDDEKLRDEIRIFDSIYHLPDTPMSMSSSGNFSIYNPDMERNIDDISNLNSTNIDSLNNEVVLSSIEDTPLSQEGDTLSYGGTSEKNFHGECVLNDNNSSNLNVISRRSSYETLNTVDEIDFSSTDDVFQKSDKLNNTKGINTPPKTPLSRRLENIVPSNYLFKKKNYHENSKLVATEKLPSYSLTSHRNVRNKRLLRGRLSSLEDYDEIPNEINYNVNIVMIGGVSGISKGELKPARNLFYSSKDNEYEYFPELNRDRTLTKIAEYEGYLFAVGGKIYVNGKWDSALEFCRYDKVNGYWIEMDTCLESPRYDHDVSVIDDKMFIVGGNNFKKDKYSIIGYDFPSEKFFKIENTVNDYIYQHSNIVKSNIIYVVGGYNHGQSRLMHRFDPRIGKLETLSFPSSPHLYSSTVLHGERIYCIGGKQNTKDTSLPFHHNEVYDIRSNKWIHMTPMPTSRCGCGGSVIGNEIFVFGGATKNGGTLKIVEKYNIFQDKWKTVKPMSEERGFFGIHTMAFN
ncbi:Kelch-like protein diablo [Strongyloides ratti]|uniref:Kelch-like protein diablo n=1 Tax=Strongyloides ratti TaxID=34506 RepID=A0A090LNP5_STRRB|nr:Kelch-like protein diablo [Strongyloides ratti]CEF69145.1 Kelch-like protein diablo [Strongyloides ratti]